MNSATAQHRRCQAATTDEQSAISSRVHELLADQFDTHQSGPQGPDYYQIVAVA